MVSTGTGCSWETAQTTTSDCSEEIMSSVLNLISVTHKFVINFHNRRERKLRFLCIILLGYDLHIVPVWYVLIKQVVYAPPQLWSWICKLSLECRGLRTSTKAALKASIKPAFPPWNVTGRLLSFSDTRTVRVDPALFTDVLLLMILWKKKKSYLIVIKRMKKWTLTQRWRRI